MVEASKTASAETGGLSGWGEADSEAFVIAKAAGKRPAGEAGLQGDGTTETDSDKAVAELTPSRQQRTGAAGAGDAVAGMGEVDMGRGRSAEGLRTGSKEQLRPKPGRN
jgi:hypothetical protein